MATPSRPTYAWWIILCLVGLDYFSSLAYLPSIAITIERELGGELSATSGVLAPLTGVGVALITLLAAVPVYWYVVGRSPHGKGGIGLLESIFKGWGGKLLVLFMLGFIATDFILTRTLSVSDAATHLLNNQLFQDLKLSREPLRPYFQGELGEMFLNFWSEQLVVTMVLSILAFGLYHYMVQTLSRGFISLAVGVVALYLVVNLIVIVSGVVYLRENPELFQLWRKRLFTEVGQEQIDYGSIGMMLFLAVKAFPPMAIGLSGFELTMASAPSVTGSAYDTPASPTGRIWRTRLLMLVAAVVMCALVLGANFVVGLLVDPTKLVGENGEIQHRALSYLAHGEKLANNAIGSSVCTFFGPRFGTLYDLSTILILCLAGAGATISMKDIVPDFLSRFGMQLSWAHRIGVITHLFNGVMLVVTVAFKASVSSQLWAYATAVLALLFGASLAAHLDLKERWRGYVAGILVRFPFLLTTLLFLAMIGLIVFYRPSGLGIAMLFVVVVLVTAIVSRWLRSTEPRFEGFEFAGDETKARWEEISKFPFQVLVPHDPTHTTLTRKEDEVRQRHRIDGSIPIIFIEVDVGDPSEFFQKPLMEIVKEQGREIIRVTRASSIAHVLAAIGLAFSQEGHPPEFYFKWSTQSPMAATMNFLLLGQGNVPFLVRTLLRNAQEDAAKRPRIIVADS